MYPEGAIIQRNDNWKSPNYRFGVKNRYIITQYEGVLKGGFSYYDSTLSFHKTWLGYPSKDYTLIQLPNGFSHALSPMHAPVCVEVWYHQPYNSDVLLRTYHNSIAAALEDAVSQLDGYGVDFSIKVTSAGGKYDILDCKCGSEFHNGMIQEVNIRLEDYPDGEEDEE